MNKIELKEKLEELRINPNYYSLDGGTLLDSQFILDHSYNYYSKDKKYDEWRVFFMERGIRYDEKIYYVEDEACKDFFDRVVKL